ncbi:MAG: TetR/AcrR family transcriptional regulator [Acholeplasma sp.]|nr:TetR/AcrR family transcriptional regulator [Acholeplasma sp.]
MESVNQRKQHIIDATLKTLKAYPIEQVSVRKIAQTAGLTTGAIYHFYKSKDDLIFDAMQQSLYFTASLYDKVEQDEQAYKGKSLLAEINKQVELRIRKSDQQKLHIQIVSDVIKKNDHLTIAYKQAYERMMEAVSKLFSKSFEIDQTMCQKSMASILIAAIDGIALQQGLDVLPENLDDMIETFIQFFNESIPVYLKNHSDCKVK